MVILFTISRSVTDFLALTTYNNLGKTLFLVSGLPNLVRSIYIGDHYGEYNVTRDLASLEKTIDKIDAFKIKIYQDLEELRYCSSSGIVDEEIVDFWEFESYPQIKKASFYNILEKMIYNGKKLLQAINNNEDYIHYFEFLYLNGLTYPYYEINKALLELEKCDEEKLKESRFLTDILLACIISVPGIAVIFLLFYVYLIEREYNKFWNQIRKSSFKNYNNLRNAVSNRLKNLHNYEISLEDNFHPNNVKCSKIKARVYLKYTFNLSLFVIFSVVFYMIFDLHIQKNIETLISNRPNLLNNFIMRSAMFSQIGTYARDLADPQKAD